jgi:hypothetical protein
VCSGSIIVDKDRRIRMSRVLLDTGALHSSYISKELIDKYRKQMASRIRKVDGHVTLGDNKTAVKVSERISLPVEFVDWKGVRYQGMIDLCVWDMPGMEMIVGLPDILDHYLNFLIDMLQAARSFDPVKGHYTSDIVENTSGVHLDTSGVFTLLERYTDLISPWTVAQDPESPEEEESYVPCSFTGPLYYLSKPYEEVVQDYYADFETHVADDWKKHTRVIELLKSDLALSVFCPAEWKGLSGFEPLELDWKPEMPHEYKPACRPINPRLFEAFNLEFARMNTYMYTDSFGY